MADLHGEWTPKHNPWAVALTVTLATFMEVLDTSIANVSLPHIAGNLSVSQQESTWVLTSYLVSNAIILPISAWLSRLFGRKRFYMASVALFTCSSFLCGLAPSLAMLVVFRILQGAGGGGLQPSEQAILADTFPPARRGIAFAVYGMAVVIAPAVGPTLGGWITDNFTWRWIFYINVPIGILSLFLTRRLVEDPPYLQKERMRGKFRMDGIGLGLIVVAIGCLQVVLDKGQEADWFSSTWITVLAVIAVYALFAWVVWEWHHPDPIVDIRLFRNRNFATAMFFSFVLGIVLFGTTVLIPQFLQVLLGYPAVLAGEALAGGGFAMLLMMPIAGSLVSRMDPRAMMALGFAATAGALYYIATRLSLQMDFGTVAMLRVYQTMGLAFIFLPSSILAYVGIPREKNNQVSAMNSFVRNLGGGIGIALISTSLTRQVQQHQNFLTAHATPSNPAFDQMTNGMSRMLESQGAAHPLQQTYGRIAGLIEGQAATLGYIDVMSMMALVVLCLVPFVLIMRRPKVQTDQVALH
ncbi:MAG TPA: DHA2 family efflux MFS transporter permease subunit [Bryobacteraceae bacterium]|nr:DHA2 family efflux MFS transporter permease subunit [Bryobacteraceae bacterium]